jgi:iron(III) transport system permease protein
VSDLDTGLAAWQDREGQPAGAPPRRIVAALGRRLGRPGVFAVAIVPLAIVVMLVVVIVWTSFAEDFTAGLFAPLTLGHYAKLFADPLIFAALGNTVGFVLVTVAVAMTFGVAAAWLVERTDLPAKELVYAVMTGGLLFPTIFLAIGWVFFLHPRIGVFNNWLVATFHLASAPFNIANVVGMGWVEGLGLTSLAFIMTSPILQALNPALDEAATVHGIGRWWSFVYVTLPLAWPGLIAAAIYIAVVAIASFEVPAVIGLGSKIYTFSTLVYIEVTPEMGTPDYGVVGAVSIFLILFSLVLSWWYFRVIRLSHRYEVVRGRAYQPRLVQLGRKAWMAWALLGSYFTLACVLPLAMMAWAAFLPYLRPFSLAAFHQMTLRNFYGVQWDLLWRATGHTLILMVTVPSAALLFGLAISWVVVRSGIKGRFLFDWVAFLPHAVPNLIFAIAMVIVALNFVPKTIPFYGTIYILMTVYVLVRISLVTRVLNGALVQIHRELEEVSHVSGISTFYTLLKVTVPLLLPAIANLWIWNALLTYRELTMAAFMATQDSVTLPVLVWNQWNAGGAGRAAAISLIFVAMFMPLIGLYWTIRSRANIGNLHA